ncbi:MAG: DUF2723 domain-containing protein [Endomicrobia bacterium]|nr:DUF2723 domain-containing protein [Endomicrobiia bacterium]
MIFFFFLITIYLFSLIYALPPTITVGDVAELVGAASNLGIAHSPGYPLFCILYKFFINILPLGDYGYRAGFISMIIFIVSGILIFIFAYKKANFLFGLFAFTFYFSQPILLKQSIIGEVFSLYNLLVVLIFYFLFSEDILFKKRFYILGFLLGLSLGCQHIIIFLIPSLVLYWLINIKIYKLNLNDVLYFLIFFIIGFLIYLYIPIRSSVEPLYDWEDPQTLDRFLYLFFRGRYGTFSLAQGGKLYFGFNSLYYGFKLFFYILGVKNLMFLLFSILVLIVNRKIKFTNITIVFFSFLFTGPLFITLTGLKNISSGNIYILERLITSSVISLVFFVIFSINILKNKKSIIYFLILLNLFSYFKNLKSISLRNNYFLYDYIVNILRNVPYDTFLLSDRADETEFGIAYYQRCLKKRNDILFVDCNASVSRSIYGNSYYMIWGQERLKIRSKVETEIINKHPNKVIYNTVLPQQTSTSKYEFGLVYTTFENYKIHIPNEIFIIRRVKDLNFRELVLYNVYLNLLSNFYFKRAIHNKKLSYVVELLYNELFFLNNDYKYLTFIPYYYFLINDFYKAEQEYLKIIYNYQLPSEVYLEILINLGVVYKKQNKFKESEECFLKAISIDPNNSQAYYNLGILYWEMNNFKKALDYFEKLLKLQPDNEEIKRYIQYLRLKL